MARVRQLFQRNPVILAVACGVLVAGVFLLALWPRGICDLSPCTLKQPGAGSACITVLIIGPCPVTAYTIAVPLVAGFVAAAAVIFWGIWEARRRDRSSL